MNNIIKKLASLYNISYLKPTYQIQYTIEVLACLFINLFGLALLLTPIYFIISILQKISPSEISSIGLDHIVMILLFSFFWLGISAGFFLHNKMKISLKLQITSFAALGLCFLVGLFQILYQFILINLDMVSNPSQNLGVLYFDLGILLIIGTLYLVNNKKFQTHFSNFLNKNLSKYQE